MTVFNGVQAEEGHIRIDLQDTDASFQGVHAAEYSGAAVAFVGDVNGDGYDDLAVGAPYNQDMGGQAGKVYLIFGDNTSWGMDTSLAMANASFLAENAWDIAGMRVSGGCDVNKDGYDDFVISAVHNSDVDTFSGKVYLILGKASGWAKDVNISIEATASFVGEAYDDQAGTDLACAEDVNGDGYDDILVGSSGNDEGGLISGQTYLIFGRDSGWAKNVSLANVNASFWGEKVGDVLGSKVAGVGDVNGDGYNDILIGAPGNTEGGGQAGNQQTQAGQVYLIFGRSSGWSMNDVLTNSDASFWGQTGHHLGFSIDGAGDVNGDGLDDLIFGVPLYSDKLVRQGKVYLYLGRETGWSLDTRLETACDASFIGNLTDEIAGTSVTGAGDFNGDGYDDILVGTGMFDPSAYVILGKSHGWSRDMNLSNTEIILNGTQRAQIADGNADFNGDGLMDIVIGDMYNHESYGSAGQSYLTYGFRLSEPTTIESVTIYSDPDLTNEITWAYMKNMVFYEVKATGGDPNKVDCVVVNISGEIVDPIGFPVRLFESGPNTDSYQGYVVLQYKTDPGNRLINTASGDHVHVTAVKDPAKSDSILVGRLTITPRMGTDTAVEDMDYHLQFSTENGTKLGMDFETDGDWLEFNTTSNLLTGVPDNTDVGTWWVKILADDGHGNNAVEEFDIQVINTAPMILKDPVFDITEDEPYYVDFNSSDDGQGNITWGLDTNASWLKIDTQTGELSGLPLNENTGYFWVNVTVEDGNGGKGCTNYTLTVHDINEPPVITTEDLTVAYEDQLYRVKYNAEDIDLWNYRFTWTLTTDAEWLHIDNMTGVLYGTPDNADVGSYQVSVSAKDIRYAEDWSNFTLEVINVPPSITTKDVQKATEDQPYNVHYSSDDDGQGDTTWSMRTNAPWLKLDLLTNNLTGLAGNEDVGEYWVDITVNDGNGGVNSTNFTLEVVNVNDPPTFESPSTMYATVDSIYNYEVVVSDIDKDDVLNFSFQKAPAGMSINNTTGMISWVPTVGQEGDQEVVVQVFDGTISVTQNFTIKVRPNLVVTITNLTEGQRIGSKYLVSGTAEGPVDLKVEVDIDGKGWQVAEGNNSWTYRLGPHKLKDGKHTMKVRSSWGGYMSEEVSLSFKVQQDQDSLGFAFLAIGLVIIIAILVGIAFYLMRRKGTNEK